MKEFAKQLCPPLFKRRLKGLFGSVRWKGDFPDWESAAQKCTGYDAPQIAENVLEKTLLVINGQAAFERDGVIFSEAEHNWPAVACIMATANSARSKPAILDFGGALGSFLHQHRQFFPQDQDWQWHVVEQPHFIELGEARIHSPGLHFHRSISECLQAAQPTFAYLSSVLQYLPDPWLILDEIAAGPFTHLLIDRTPFTERDTDRITIQRVSGEICQSRYPCRFFSYQSFLKRLSRHWKLQSEWEDLIDPCNLSDCQFRGLFFKRPDV